MKIGMFGKENPFYGKKHSEETRKKMSENHADFFGEKNPFYNKKHTEETKNKISENHADFTGEKNPNFGKGELMRGELNPNWRGGSEEGYCLTWNDKEFIEYISDRDKSRFCWNPECRGKGKVRVRHHIDYVKKNCDPENVITICDSCNVRANFNYDLWINLYKEVMGDRGLLRSKEGVKV